MSQPAPWTLTGESIVGLARVGRRIVLVVAARYSGSPVGPYHELAIGSLGRLGARVGWRFSTVVVDSPESRLAGRSQWGFPKELATLEWSRDGDVRSLRWVERGIEVRGTAGRLRAPVLVPVRALQRRSDGPVVVPGRLRGLGRVAKVEVSTPEDDVLAPLAGAHRGCVVDGMRFVIRPARVPLGLTSSLRAPLHAPEPALSCPAPAILSNPKGV